MKITFEFATQDDCLDRMVPSDLRVLVAQRDRLQARVAELYDLIKYAQVDSGVCMCGDDIKDHNQASGHMPLDIWDHAVEQINKEGSSEAFILRKQAEAVEAVAEQYTPWGISQKYTAFAVSQHLEVEAKRLSNEADTLEKTEGTKLYTHPASRRALEGEAVDVERIADTVRDYLGDIFACTRVWEAWQVGTMTQNDFTPADETELADEIATAVAEIYTHPASADKQAVSVPKQWVDLMRELMKDLISEIKTKQKLKPDERVAEDLGAVREAIAMIAKQEQGHE